jgi:hypothetical protein
LFILEFLQKNGTILIIFERVWNNFFFLLNIIDCSLWEAEFIR